MRSHCSSSNSFVGRPIDAHRVSVSAHTHLVSADHNLRNRCTKDHGFALAYSRTAAMSRIREVWAPQLEAEMRNIRELIDKYPYVAMVYSFVLHRPSNPSDLYPLRIPNFLVSSHAQ